MATKKLTIASGKVAGSSHSNMPLVVIPSEITNFGSITLAEAQSIRIYTDSSLVTEIPRECVGADETHTKPSTVTSSSEYWVDYDGIRADYAVTDTYGAEAVWSDYEMANHNVLTDSSGNGMDSSSGSSTLEDPAQIGVGRAYNGSNQRTGFPNNSAVENVNGNFSASVWTKKPASDTSDSQVLGNFTGSGGVSPNQAWMLRTFSTGVVSLFVRRDANAQTVSINSAATVNDGNWHLLHFTKSGVNIELFINGVSQGTGSFSVDGNTDNNQNLGVAWHFNRYYRGSVEELRILKQTLTPDWITTEYNNQSDNGAFWVAEDAGAPPAANNAGFLVWW